MYMSLRKYRNPVPSKPPENAITDSTGRQWVRSCTISNEFYSWDGDYWYVWFKGKLEPPEEGETIRFENSSAEVVSVLRSYRSMRAVVELNLYKDY